MLTLSCRYSSLVWQKYVNRKAAALKSLLQSISYKHLSIINKQLAKFFIRRKQYHLISLVRHCQRIVLRAFGKYPLWDRQFKFLKITESVKVCQHHIKLKGGSEILGNLKNRSVLLSLSNVCSLTTMNISFTLQASFHERSLALACFKLINLCICQWHKPLLHAYLFWMFKIYVILLMRFSHQAMDQSDQARSHLVGRIGVG